MIDPLVSLAFAIYSNKGAYALLLGSGVSRSAAIPTGWEVVVDLVRKVAKLEGEDPEPDPEAWFTKKYGAAPEYSKLLDIVAKTGTERQRLLKSYFEPSEDDRAQGLKTPTAAHRAIAELARDGYIRVILTTNFDRLLERAMEERGLTPTIIATVDQISGALPLAHAGVTIIKLHGDYLDTRIKNTAKELAKYNAKVNALVDRILDEYGLIICGWSAEWDVALREAMERCVSRRFTTFWTSRAPLTGDAKSVALLRRAELIRIADADHFFISLNEKVRALDDTNAAHPLSAKIAIATVKRLLTDPAGSIRLHDLITEETENAASQLTETAFPAAPQLRWPEELPSRIAKFESICDTLRGILITGGYWGDDVQCRLWIRCLERIANSNENRAGLVPLVNLRRYPALLLLFAAGIAAVAADKHGTLWRLLTEAKAKDENNRPEPICCEVFPHGVVSTETGRLLPEMERRFTPINDHLNTILRDPLREYLPSDEDYQNAFDRFEYLLGMAHADLNRREVGNGWWGPVGRFRWRGRHFPESQIMARINAEIHKEGSKWAPLTHGFFDGDFDRAKQAKQRYDAFLSQIDWF